MGQHLQLMSIANKAAYVSENPPFRLNLKAIESSLHAVQREFPQINAHLSARRDTLDDEVVENMMAGYAFIDTALANECDLFALGNSKRLLELNTLVLCGKDPAKRNQYREHSQATEQRFYEAREGGIGDIIEWYALHQKESVWKRTAGVYIRILSQPQLYIEGNHRTGALIMSYILAREGQPPFVLTVDNAKAYFDPSTLIRDTKRHGIALLVRLPKIKKNFARFLKEQTDPRYLSQIPPSSSVSGLPFCGKDAASSQKAGEY